MTRVVAGQLAESRSVRVDDADLVGGLNFIDLACEDDLPCELVGSLGGWNRIVRERGKRVSRKIEIRRCNGFGRGRRSKVGGRRRLKSGKQVCRRG